MNNNNQQPNKPGRTNISAHNNFIEALKGAGASATKDPAKKLGQTMADMPNDLLDSFFNSKPDSTAQNQTGQPFESNQESDFDWQELFQKKEAHNRVKQDYEQTETVLFNRRNEEVKRKIEEIQKELKKLAGEIVHLNQSTQTAIEEEVVDPGTYHMNFFEQLLSFLVGLRKRVTESRHWASMAQNRSKTKSYYWKQADKKAGGTKYMLSQERQVATQTG